ncbi:MAG: L-2-amino-thiazoline-4-carboxylic acid hydrolase [Atopobiaceae bacterium]|nr:L-2-amino-thiazoline-4-carboxylic acid hydrolase [Atopobiaceae bacterium]
MANGAERVFEPLAMVANSRFADLFAQDCTFLQTDILERIAKIVEENPAIAVKPNYGHFCNLSFALAYLFAHEARGEERDGILDRLATHMYGFVEAKHRSNQEAFAREGLDHVRTHTIPVMMEMEGHGWHTEVVEDKADAVAYDIKQCIFATLCPAYGVPELGPVFCHVDDIVLGELPGAVFEREGTICLGADRCDFRFRSV